MGQYLVPIAVIFVACVQVSLAYIESLAGNVLIHTSDSRKYEPMVAFMCNKPTMVRVPNGWIHDDKQNCTDDPRQILNYCQKKYPNHEITTVVHHHEQVTINNWCRVGNEHCHRHNSHTVTPYRCIVGPFQSRALLVPEHCVFDHYHDSSVCANENHWNETSNTRCDAKNLERQSFDILLPCPTTDQFMGVEYVCCPHPQKPSVTINVHVEHPHKAPEVAIKNPTDAPTPLPAKPDTQGPYLRYIHEHLDRTKDEHENYELARRDWHRYHQAKITRIMKDWTTARDKVVELKASDPKTAERLNTDIGQKFQKLYHAMEEEGTAERAQLNTLHQNHVQKKFNELKRESMQRFMDELQRDTPQESKLLKSLERYLRVEEKDRRHTVNHYEHMKDVDPQEAKRILSVTVDHLRWIDKRILQSIKMLHRFPKMEEQLRPQIEGFLRRFTGIAASSHVITSPVVEDEQKVAVEEYRAREKTTLVTVTQAPTTVAEKMEPETQAPTVKAVPIPVIEEVIVKKVKKVEEPEQDPNFDPETMEDEHKYYDEEKNGFVAHQTDSRLNEETYAVHKEAVQVGGVYGATVGIAIGSVSVFAVIIVAVLMLKKRQRKPQITHGFVEVDRAVSPEERHVANMQINGYENPTYKYFEK